MKVLDKMHLFAFIPLLILLVLLSCKDDNGQDKPVTINVIDQEVDEDRLISIAYFSTTVPVFYGTVVEKLNLCNRIDNNLMP